MNKYTIGVMFIRLGYHCFPSGKIKLELARKLEEFYRWAAKQ